MADVVRNAEMNCSSGSILVHVLVEINLLYQFVIIRLFA